jgi:hypothetical protein
MIDSYDPLADRYSMYNPDTCNGEKIKKTTQSVKEKAAQATKVAEHGPSTTSEDGILDRGPFGSTTDKIRLLDEDDLK